MVPTLPPLVVVMTREVRERSKSITSSPRRLATPTRLPFDPPVTRLPPTINKNNYKSNVWYFSFSITMVEN